jgi:hypothetical protein
VTPIPRTVICASVMVSGSGPSGPGMSQKTAPVAMTTRLLSTGAHIGGPNRPRVLRYAPMTAPAP